MESLSYLGKVIRKTVQLDLYSCRRLCCCQRFNVIKLLGSLRMERCLDDKEYEQASTLSDLELKFKHSTAQGDFCKFAIKQLVLIEKIPE
ncbi:unnamed protein product [Allacma fusca]|uniref:Uncharacterized protein n=1 Tax=Allacma fusca TaxID=39272 RepID=A0A8J2PDR9_9HEXA|nr:unnamed protein product [Allacma fusca]